MRGWRTFLRKQRAGAATRRGAPRRTWLHGVHENYKYMLRALWAAMAIEDGIQDLSGF